MQMNSISNIANADYSRDTVVTMAGCYCIVRESDIDNTMHSAREHGIISLIQFPNEEHRSLFSSVCHICVETESPLELQFSFIYFFCLVSGLQDVQWLSAP